MVCSAVVRFYWGVPVCINTHADQYEYTAALMTSHFAALMTSHNEYVKHPPPPIRIPVQYHRSERWDLNGHLRNVVLASANGMGAQRSIYPRVLSKEWGTFVAPPLPSIFNALSLKLPFSPPTLSLSLCAALRSPMQVAVLCVLRSVFCVLSMLMCCSRTQRG